MMPVFRPLWQEKSNERPAWPGYLHNARPALASSSQFRHTVTQFWQSSTKADQFQNLLLSMFQNNLGWHCLCRENTSLPIGCRKLGICKNSGVSMYIYICIYVSTNTCIDLCIYVYMYVCIYWYMYLCIYVYIYVCIYIYICIYVYMYIICICVYMHVCIYLYIYIYIYIYIGIYVYIYICIFIYIYVCIYVYMYICIYVYLYVRIYSYMYAYIYIYIAHCIYMYICSGIKVKWSGWGIWFGARVEQMIALDYCFGIQSQLLHFSANWVECVCVCVCVCVYACVPACVRACMRARVCSCACVCAYVCVCAVRVCLAGMVPAVCSNPCH